MSQSTSLSFSLDRFIRQIQVATFLVIIAATPQMSHAEYNFENPALTRITFDPSDDYEPSWSPASDFLVFSSNRDGDYEIYTISIANNDTVQQITDNDMDDRRAPKWSPDGARIVYTAGEYPLSSRDIYYIAVSDGGSPNSSAQQVTDTEDNDERGTTWSPDGSRIAYGDTNSEGENNIWISDYDGANAYPLTATSSVTGGPDWSYDTFLDGVERIVFITSCLECLEDDITLYKASGAFEGFIHLPGKQSHVSWSPDGQWIAFDTFENNRFAIYVVPYPYNDEEPTKINIPLDYAFLREPRWSPDGRFIAFSAKQTTSVIDTQDIYIIEVQ